MIPQSFRRSILILLLLVLVASGSGWSRVSAGGEEWRPVDAAAKCLIEDMPFEIGLGQAANQPDRLGPLRLTLLAQDDRDLPSVRPGLRVQHEDPAQLPKRQGVDRVGAVDDDRQPVGGDDLSVRIGGKGDQAQRRHRPEDRGEVVTPCHA